MTLYWTDIHTQIFGTMLQIRHVMVWMIAHREQLPDQVSLFLGAYIITAIAFARKTLEIINNPTVVAPLLGRRCMFY